MATSAFERTQKAVLLAERAREAVRSGTYGSSGWRLSELGFPRLVGAAIAKITAAGDGQGYIVRIYTLEGVEICERSRRTLRGSFATGERLAQTAGLCSDT